MYAKFRFIFVDCKDEIQVKIWLGLSTNNGHLKCAQNFPHSSRANKSFHMAKLALLAANKHLFTNKFLCARLMVNVPHLSASTQTRLIMCDAWVDERASERLMAKFSTTLLHFSSPSLVLTAARI